MRTREEMTRPETPSPTTGSEPAGPVLDFAAIREKLASESGPRYWRGLEELAETEEFQSFLDREFPKHASEWDDSLEQGFSRRRFLELGMASLALGGLAACTRQPQEKIIPYVKQPEELLPGVPLYFASTALHGGYGIGILVESHLGRPTKLEGNPEHPGSLGTTSLFTQSALLDLYDPERTQTVRKLETNKTWLQLTEEITAKLPAWKGLLGEGVRILTETVTSPALADQIGTFLEKHPKAKWIQWEPAGRSAVREASQLAFGQYVETTYDFTKANVVVGLDADFMIDGPGAVRYQHDFATRRRARKDAAEMSRYYAIESTPTSSGTVADHRLPLTPRRVFLFAQALAAALGVPGIEKPEIDMVLSQHVVAASLDLKAAGAAGLVVAGEHTPAALQVLVHAINAALGNAGTAVIHREPAEARPIDQLAALKELVGEMNEGKVETLLIADANPVFTAPPDLGFTEALKKVGLRIHIGRETDETAEYCQWQLPSAHFLETWGDARAFDGTASLVQPVIEPLYGGKSLLEVMDLFLEKTRNGHDIVKAYWLKKLGAPGFEAAWRKALHDGVLAGSASATVTPALKAEAVTAAAGTLNAMPTGAFSVVFRPDPTIGDGRFANNGWLQELPKPHTRLVWDNAALVGFSTAEKLGVRNHDVVEIKVGSRSVKAPVWVLQGQAADTITLHFGYGRRKTGKVGSGTGFDAYAIRTSDALSVAAAEVTKTGATYKLVSSQTHFRMEGRDLVRSTKLADFAEEHGGHGHGFVPKPDDTLFLPLYDYSKQVTDHAWGMSVDLTT
ncbi:MAG: TAT-variant-translocated molybdopterin oxidoreductase, partial [Acidobacteria bacterium]|nr:TAT-variant-translocated molybdopterin oxidoreductase [Acidobacteriota bacterium]